MSVVAISTSSFGKESGAPLDALRAAGHEVRLNPHGRTLTSDEAREHLRGVVGLIAGTERLTADVLRGSPGLRAIARVGVGMDGVDAAACKELGIALSNTPEAHVDAVAELALAGLLALCRHLPRIDQTLRDGNWYKPMGRLLAGKTIGVIGFGRVGRAFIRLLAPFGGARLAYDPAGQPTPGVEQVGLDELLGAADVVSLHLPYTEAVHHLIGPAELACLKYDALLVNTARGGLIDEVALANHLHDHPHAGAYLDCFEHEPYDGTLIETPNVVLSTHIGSYAREARVRMEQQAVENLLKDLAR